MQNLNKILKTPLRQPVTKGLLIFLFIVAAIGFIDATYLTVEHFGNRIPPCTTDGCEIVLTSKYAEFFGIPVALGGALYYFAILVALMAYFDTKREIILRGTLLFTVVGFLVSAYLFFLQAKVIGAFCQYCLVSAGTSTTLFIIAVYIFKKYRQPVTTV